ncbi:RHS repeat-associated core domain-containing protein [Streptomyces sp. NPDC008317]|uniref:RHS repeat-associated core domain-containing protein n=1 Tax=Streptomyces sp. NPDC008317 TaxID=3364827 RepID=UPI0036E9C6A2
MGVGGVGGNVTTYTYDALGRPHTATDGRGITTTDAYDDRDRTTGVTASGGATVGYVFDGDGNQTSRTDATGTTTYLPDALNRESLRTLADGSATLLTYDPAGNVVTYTDPTGPVVYGYDNANYLKTLKDPSGSTTTYQYNNDDVLTSVAYPGGTTQTITPDNSGRPSNIKTAAGSTTLVDLSYTYTSGKSGTDGDLRHTRTDNQAGKTITYSYDSHNRLAKAKESATAIWLYCYDAAGNTVSATAGSDDACPGTTTYTYNDASELTSKNGSATGWTYNPAGDETNGASTTGIRTGETWSDFNQLTSLTAAGTAYTAAYAGTDNAERTQLGATAFHNGPEGLAASTATGADTGFTREPGGTLNSMRTGGKSYYYLTDADGSVLGLVDNAAHRVNTYTYNPTGMPRTGGVSETVPQPYRYYGAYLDPTGLYKMGARYYDAVTERFTQTDPNGLGFLDAVSEWAGPVGDLAQAGYHAYQGDTKALWGDLAGVMAGGIVGGMCTSLAVAGAPETEGISLVAGLRCYALSNTGSQYVSGEVSG